MSKLVSKSYDTINNCQSELIMMNVVDKLADGLAAATIAYEEEKKSCIKLLTMMLEMSHDKQNIIFGCNFTFEKKPFQAAISELKNMKMGKTHEENFENFVMHLQEYLICKEKEFDNLLDEDELQRLQNLCINCAHSFNMKNNTNFKLDDFVFQLNCKVIS